MSRKPDETAWQWSARASAQYRVAWAAFEVEWRRVGGPGSVSPRGYPLLDERYDSAMDALEDADNERGEATIAFDREHQPMFSDAGPPRRRQGRRR